MLGATEVAAVIRDGRHRRGEEGQRSNTGIDLTFVRSALVFLIALAACSAPARAQTGVGDIPDDGPDPNTVEVHIGPFLMDPRIEVPNMGIDTNVFNEASNANPKQDFTATVSPTTNVWMRIGRSWLKVNIREDLVWFQKYTTERSVNSFYTVDWHLPLNRLIVDVEPHFLSARDRPGFEIDARSQRAEYGGKVGIAVRAFSKTFLAFTGSRDKVNFDSFATFDGISLREALNRTVTIGSIALRHQLTPLTTLAVTLGREQDRFEFSPLRDANSNSVSASVSFDPHALLKGNASFGYRNFQPVLAGLPAYQGSIASGNLSYTLLGMTQVSGGFTRDVQYSFDVTQPYYLQTGISGQIAQQIFGPVDLQVRGGTQQLAYRDRIGVAVDVPNRTDYVRTYGGGVGYHFSGGMRIGFNVDHYHRTSDVDQFQYDGLKYGTALTYVF